LPNYFQAFVSALKNASVNGEIVGILRLEQSPTEFTVGITGGKSSDQLRHWRWREYHEFSREKKA
jgi:hypothetical protein